MLIKSFQFNIFDDTVDRRQKRQKFKSNSLIRCETTGIITLIHELNNQKIILQKQIYKNTRKTVERPCNRE